jgi:Methyltransferase FkbM domain
LFPKVFGDIYAYHSPLRTFIVDMTTLDDFCSGAKIDNIDFLKIDVEGGEFDVLLGAQEMIARRSIAIIHFEFNSMNIFTKHFLRDFDALLPGYRLYRVCPTTLLELARLPVVCQEIFGYQNILAIREDRVPEVTGRLM